MSTRSERDRQKSLQDKYQMILSQLLKDEDNKYCVDCDAKGLFTYFSSDSYIFFYSDYWIYSYSWFKCK